MSVSVQLDSRELVEELRAMVDAASDKELTQIIYEEAKPIQDEARRNLEPHKRTGMLAKYVTRSKGKPRIGLAQVAIGIKAGGETKTIPVPTGLQGFIRRLAGRNVKRIEPYRYAHFLEDGFLHALTGRRVPGTRFMERAYRSQINGVGTKILDRIARLILARRGGGS